MNALGLAGEVFVESHCRQNKIKYRKATRGEDIKLGIDVYMGEEETPTDIKNTNYIFSCQILEDGIINTRHPFKKDSQATHYCFVNVDATAQGNFIEHVAIKDKLLRDIVSTPIALDNLYTYLQSIDQTSYKDIAPNLVQASFRIKMKLQEFCKKGVLVTYEEPESNQEVSFKMRKEKEVKKPNIQSIESIRDMIKNRKEGNVVEVEVEEFNIVTIKI